MPKYNPSGDEMDASYAQAPGADNESSDTETPSPRESVDRENEEGNTTLVPNKILSPDGEPINEGDEIVVRVVKNYGDESEIEYAPKKEQEGEYGSDEPMSEVSRDMAALDQEKE